MKTYTLDDFASIEFKGHIKCSQCDSNMILSQTEKGFKANDKYFYVIPLDCTKCGYKGSFHLNLLPE